MPDLRRESGHRASSARESPALTGYLVSLQEKMLLGLHCVSAAIDLTLKNDGATSLLPICVYMCVTQIGVCGVLVVVVFQVTHF
jgi:hypothetical protein